MIGPKTTEALNAQIQAEHYSSYLYLSMSAYCDVKNLKGFAHWLRVQSKEEADHAGKLLDHLIARGGRPSLRAIEAPPAEFGTMAEVFVRALEHERQVTGLVHRLYEVAQGERDIATQVFLNWFVSEQVEEEARASEVLEKIRMVEDRPGSLLYLDKEMKKREA